MTLPEIDRKSSEEEEEEEKNATRIVRPVYGLTRVRRASGKGKGKGKELLSPSAPQVIVALEVPTHSAQ